MKKPIESEPLVVRTTFRVPREEGDDLSHGVLCALPLLEGPAPFGKWVTNHQHVKVKELTQNLKNFILELETSMKTLKDDKELKYTCGSQINGIKEALENLNDDSTVEYFRVKSRKVILDVYDRYLRSHYKLALFCSKYKVVKENPPNPALKEKDIAPMPYSSESIPMAIPESQHADSMDKSDSNIVRNASSSSSSSVSNEWSRPWEVFPDCTFPPESEKSSNEPMPENRNKHEREPQRKRDSESEQEHDSEPKYKSNSKSKSKEKEKEKGKEKQKEKEKEKPRSKSKSKSKSKPKQEEREREREREQERERQHEEHKTESSDAEPDSEPKHHERKRHDKESKKISSSKLEKRKEEKKKSLSSLFPFTT